MPRDRVLDIFVLLKEIDQKNYNAWNSLTDEQQKQFSPLVTMRWMAGTFNEYQLIMLNELVNVLVYPLGNHPEFLLKLLTVCSSNGSKRYSWINYNLSRPKRKGIAIKLIADHYNLSLKEANETLKLFDSKEIMELGESHGFQKDELRALKKEME